MTDHPNSHWTRRPIRLNFNLTPSKILLALLILYLFYTLRTSWSRLEYGRGYDYDEYGTGDENYYGDGNRNGNGNGGVRKFGINGNGINGMREAEREMWVLGGRAGRRGDRSGGGYGDGDGDEEEELEEAEIERGEDEDENENEEQTWGKNDDGTWGDAPQVPATTGKKSSNKKNNNNKNKNNKDIKVAGFHKPKMHGQKQKGMDRKKKKKEGKGEKSKLQGYREKPDINITEGIEAYKNRFRKDDDGLDLDKEGGDGGEGETKGKRIQGKKNKEVTTKKKSKSGPGRHSRVSKRPITSKRPIAEKKKKAGNRKGDVDDEGNDNVEDLVNNIDVLASLQRIQKTLSSSSSSAGGAGSLPYYYGGESGASSNPLLQSLQPTSSSYPKCRNLPGSSDILLILKTGATEIYEKLPPHFLTTLLCPTQYLLFSDYEQNLGPYHIHDALSGSHGVSSATKQTHPDFSLYRNIREAFSSTQDLAQLKSQNREGWNLDKWKFIPMLLKVYSHDPNKKWYVIMEADTYISWSNLLLWLRGMPEEKLVYAGCQVVAAGTTFAHGGSGFVLSNSAMRSLVEQGKGEGTMEEWEKRTSRDCCGDKVLSEALQDGGVPTMMAWPTVQGETIRTLDWSRRHWCSPAVSWHHLSGMELDRLWEFDQRWIARYGWEKPILFMDYFEHFVGPYLQDHREDWDNLSRDVLLTHSGRFGAPNNAETDKQKVADESWGKCREACEEDKECIQYKFEKLHETEQACRLGKVIRMGNSIKKGEEDYEDVNEMVAGWSLMKIHDYKKEFYCDHSEDNFVTEVPEPLDIEKRKEERREKEREEREKEEKEKEEKAKKEEEEKAAKERIEQALEAQRKEEEDALRQQAAAEEEERRKQATEEEERQKQASAEEGEGEQEESQNPEDVGQVFEGQED